MLNSENSTDRLFREKLLTHKVVPPSGIWDNIVNDMDAKSRRKRMIWLWGFSSAASLLFAFLAGWYVAVKLPAEKNLQADTHQIKTEIPSQVVTAQPSTQNIKVNTNTHFFQPNETIQLTENTVSTSEKLISTSEESQRESIVVKLLSPLEPLLLKARDNASNLIAINSQGFSDSDRAIIAMNTNKKSELSKNNNHSTWAVGVQASPIYRFDQASGSVKQGADPLYSFGTANGTTSYVTSISAGIKVELNTGSRFSVQSGVNYGEIAQNAGNVGVSYNGHNWVNDRTDTDVAKGIASNQDGVNSLSNNMVLKTQMGLTNIAMPEGANLATDNITNNYSSEVARNFNLEQQADYLEIPLIVRYKIIDSRVDFLLLGGINTNVLMSNNASLVDKQEVIGNGTIEGLNPLTFSSSVGMGVNYAISERFNLSVEPTMKIQLNSLNKQTSYNSRPYAVGIFTGISYQF